MYALRPLAVRDIDTHAANYREQAGDAVSRAFLDAARDTFQLLATQPAMGWKAAPRHPSLQGLRVFRLRRFTRILVIYLPRPTGVDILRVIHGARDLERLLQRDGM